MSYTKTTWSDGDVITAEKLNNIESGVESASTSGSILIVHKSGGIFDKTWQEICDAINNMTPVYIYSTYEYGDEFGYSLDLIYTVYFENDKYRVDTFNSGSFWANSSSDYPRADEVV